MSLPSLLTCPARVKSRSSEGSSECAVWRRFCSPRVPRQRRPVLDRWRHLAISVPACPNSAVRWPSECTKSRPQPHYRNIHSFHSFSKSKEQRVDGKAIVVRRLARPPARCCCCRRSIDRSAECTDGIVIRSREVGVPRAGIEF